MTIYSPQKLLPDKLSTVHSRLLLSSAIIQVVPRDTYYNSAGTVYALQTFFSF